MDKKCCFVCVCVCVCDWFCTWAYTCGLWAALWNVYMIWNGPFTVYRKRVTKQSANKFHGSNDQEISRYWYTLDGPSEIVKVLPPNTNIRSTTLIFCMYNASFYVHSQNCGKSDYRFRILFYPHIHPYGKTLLPRDGFSWKLIFECFYKVYGDDLSLNKIWQE